MSKQIRLEDLEISTKLVSGDLGYITYLHGFYYHQEYNYGLSFEYYVAEGLQEFYRQFNPSQDGIWIAKIKEQILGCLVLIDRGDGVGQVRFFFLKKEARGIGLGKKLIGLLMQFLSEKSYKKAYLWTTDELHIAAKLYQDVGFVKVEEKQSDVFGKQLTEQKYEVNLL